jgi:predicted DNA-binding transcriptional regulator YafY
MGGLSIMRADRLIKLMLLLQVHGKVTTEILATELNVSRRTVLRDIDALSTAGVPIYAVSGHGGGVALDENYRVRLTGLKETELQALIVSNNVRLLADIGLDEAAEVSMLKVLGSIPSVHEQSARDIQNRLHIDPIAWWRQDYAKTYLNDLKQAVFEEKVIEITYLKHNGDVVEYRIAPYGLVAKGSVWYLVAAHQDEYRSYRVSRIRMMRVLPETFQRDPEFDLNTHWQNSIAQFVTHYSVYRFSARISEEKSRFIEWYTPGSYLVLSRHEDGWFVAQFEVESVEVALMLLFALGEQAEIIHPAQLREIYLARLEAVLKRMTGRTDA